MTPANSSIIDVQTFPSDLVDVPHTGPDAFSFTIASPLGASAQTEVWYFSGDNNLNGGDSTYSLLNDGITYYFAGDPPGTWNYSPVSAPDAASSFELLLGAASVLGACKRFVPNRA